ncbi:MAG: hypothetical protein AB7K09_22525 [Planctomycetota bacterium]
MKFTFTIPVGAGSNADATEQLKTLGATIETTLKEAWPDHALDRSGAMNSGNWNGSVNIAQGWRHGVGVSIASHKPKDDAATTRDVTVNVTAFSKAEQALYGIPGLALFVLALVLGATGVIPLIIPGNMISALVYGVIGAALGYAVGRPLRPLLIGELVKENAAFGDEVAAKVKSVLPD